MSAVVPPTAPPTPPSGGSGAVVALQVLSDAKAIAALPSGALLDAVAQARAAKGLIEAMTDAGPVLLKALPGQTLPAIPDGARLQFQMFHQGGEPQLRLLAINGRPLMGAPIPGMAVAGAALPPGLVPPGMGSSPAGPPGPIGGPSGQLQSGGVPQGGANPAAPLGLAATLIRPAVPPGQAPIGGPTGGGVIPGQTGGLPADLPPGTQLTVRIAGMTPPGAPPMAAPGAPGQPSQSPATPPRAAPPPAASQPAPFANPAAPVAGGAPAMPTLHGSVVAHPPGGQAVVQTSIGTMALPTQADLPVGTGLRLEVIGPPLPPAASSATAARPEGLTNAGWPALTEAAETLVGDRQAFDQLMRNIPHAGPRLAATLSVFAAAQRSGDVRAVLSEGPTKALDKAGRKDLAERLKADLEDLSSESARPLGNNEWRGYTLPFVNGGMVDPIRLYVRGGGAEDQRPAGGTGNEQRFVLDFSLSHLGRLQLDGLVRREEKLFDLIIRTDEPLSEPVRRDIMAIFVEASALGGTKGGVSFHTGGRWVDPLPDTGPTRIEA